MSWNQMKLGELYDVHNGLSKGSNFFGSGYPFLSFSVVFNNFFIPDDLNDLVQSTEKEQESFSIKSGDVFITRTSETMDELGMSCVALKDYEKATYNGFTKRLRPKTEELVLPKYIGYYLRTPMFRGKFKAFSSMTTRASLKNEDLLNMEIPVPPLEIQQRIADILSAYDDLIENNQKQIKLLEEAAQRLYKEWFVDLRFPGHEQVKIVDGVPEGWGWKRLDSILDFIRGKSYTGKEIQGSEGIKLVNLNNIQPFGGYKPDQEKIFNGKYNDCQIVSHGDLIMGVTDMTQERRLVGHVALIPQFDEKAIISMDLIKLVPFDVPKIFLYAVCKYGNVSRHISAFANGTNVLHLRPEVIMGIKILVPDDKLLQTFEQEFGVMVNKVELLHKQIKLLQEARNRLLPKLMSGEIEL